MKIGFIGLGIMGSRMAADLQKNDYPLVVFNRTRAKAEPLLGPCGTFSDSPAKLAEQVDVLFTMLAHPDAVEQAAMGANGFLEHLKPNSLWVDCSSVNPSFSKKMAAEAARRQVRFVDAPVTGSAVPAAEAKLIFWVGADPADLETIRPLLLCMGNKIVHTGGHGTGASMKMVVNLLLGNAMATFAEGMALGEGLGISRKVLFDSLLGTPAVAPFLVSKREKIESGKLRSRISVALDAKGYASRIAERVRIWRGHAGNQRCERTVSPRDARRARDPGFLGHIRLSHDDPSKAAGSGEGSPPLI